MLRTPSFDSDLLNFLNFRMRVHRKCSTFGQVRMNPKKKKRKKKKTTIWLVINNNVLVLQFEPVPRKRAYFRKVHFPLYPQLFLLISAFCSSHSRKNPSGNWTNGMSNCKSSFIKSFVIAFFFFFTFYCMLGAAPHTQ